MVLKKLETLSPPQKRVVAKELMDVGYSSRTLEDLLGADYSTIARWAREDTPENLQRFATQFRSELAIQKQKGTVMVMSRLLELIPKERKIDQVVKAGEFLEGKHPEQPEGLKRRVVAEEFFGGEQ